MGGGVGSPPVSPPVLLLRSSIIVEGIPVRKNRRDNSDPYVGISWEIIDSPAWKTLTPSAVWLYTMLKRQYRKCTGDLHLVLPYRHVSFRLTGAAFRKAREELVRAGFIAIIRQGGLERRPNIYALSEKWRQVSAALLRDPSAGSVVRRWESGKMVEGWYPNKPERGNDNIVSFNNRGRKGRPREHPSKPALIQASQKAACKGEPRTC